MKLHIQEQAGACEIKHKTKLMSEQEGIECYVCPSSSGNFLQSAIVTVAYQWPEPSLECALVWTTMSEPQLVMLSLEALCASMGNVWLVGQGHH